MEWPDERERKRKRDKDKGSKQKANNIEAPINHDHKETRGRKWRSQITLIKGGSSQRWDEISHCKPPINNNNNNSTATQVEPQQTQTISSVEEQNSYQNQLHADDMISTGGPAIVQERATLHRGTCTNTNPCEQDAAAPSQTSRRITKQSRSRSIHRSKDV